MALKKSYNLVKKYISDNLFVLCYQKENMQDYSTLKQQAILAKQNSYSPYSHFAVGACLLCKNGNIYKGCNIENASFGATICAERVAIFDAISKGEKDFVAMAIASDGQDFPYPCGICRQVMTEFCDDIDIILINNNGKTMFTTLQKLFPNSFKL